MLGGGSTMLGEFAKSLSPSEPILTKVLLDPRLRMFCGLRGCDCGVLSVGKEVFKIP